MHNFIKGFMSDEDCVSADNVIPLASVTRLWQVGSACPAPKDTVPGNTELVLDYTYCELYHNSWLTL